MTRKRLLIVARRLGALAARAAHHRRWLANWAAWNGTDGGPSLDPVRRLAVHIGPGPEDDRSIARRLAARAGVSTSAALVRAVRAGRQLAETPGLEDVIDRAYSARWAERDRRLKLKGVSQ